MRPALASTASVLRNALEMVKRSVKRSAPRVGLGSRGLLLAAVVVSEACAGHTRPIQPAPPTAQTRVTSFSATAYCKGTVTATGRTPTEGTVAADPAILPMGSRIRLTGLPGRYDGDYIVLDTGAAIRGRRIDLYIRDCREAVKFGRRTAAVSLLH
jgi:3D (Asp-Asp-Asp) domain-containing protein